MWQQKLKDSIKGKDPTFSNTNTIYDQFIFNQSYLREKSTINEHHGDRTVWWGEPLKTKHKNSFGKTEGSNVDYLKPSKPSMP